jgi:hypothetical protein
MMLVMLSEAKGLQGRAISESPRRLGNRRSF